MAELPFSYDEFEARVGRVRAGMRERGLEVLYVTGPENLYYLTGFSTPGYYQPQGLLLPLDGDPIFFTYEVEAELARGSAIAKGFAAYGPNDSPMVRLAAAIREHGMTGARFGVEKTSWFFTVALFEELRAELPEARFEDGSGLVEASRAVKSDAEVALVREGARIASAAMRAAMAEIRPGSTENAVAAAAYDGALREGGEYPGSPPYVASGPRVEIQHATWSRRRIEAGDPVTVELSGCTRRYSGSLMRTFQVGGEPAPEVPKIEAAIVGGLNAAIERIRPGVASGDVDAACRGVVEDAGYSYPHETGYSIGACFPPGWNETHVFNLKPGDERVLQPNMTFHLVPHVIVPGKGTFGASETVLVTQTGCEVLTDFPRRLVRID